MSTFYYWLPDVAPSILLPELSKMGLGYALEDKHTARGCSSGPDGSTGTVVCHGGNQNGQLGYWADRQTWRRVPGSQVWCGYYPDRPPTPENLARTHQVTGQWIVLDDGHRWLVPIARRWIEVGDRLLWDYNLPRSLKLDEDGQWIPGDVKPQYRRLWDLAMAYETAVAEAQAKATEEDDVVRFEFPEINTLAVGALQVNYRISAIELDLLGIYDDAARQQIIRVLLDMDTWKRWEKKKRLAVDHAGESS